MIYIEGGKKEHHMDMHMKMVLALAVVTTALCVVILCFRTYSRKHLSKSNGKTVPNSSGIEATMTGFEPSSSFSYQSTYDVFVNFRGEDTRHGFTGHLYNALKKARVRTFFDDEGIRGGDEITPTLFKAIENSRMAITIFSKNYASSTFCLNELVKIHECIKRKGRLVLPVFYDVDPSEVRHQKGNYEQALSMHIKNLKADEDRIRSWKLALQEVANISGHHFVHGQNSYEYQFIERIVKEISNIINRVPLQVCDYPIGLETRVKEITSLLQIAPNEEAIMVGICGMGGLGKSTLARALYNSIADNFEDLCFINDVKETSMKVGLNGIQEIILSNIGVDVKKLDVSEVIEIMKSRFKEKKILLILDNVDNHDQLKKLAGGCSWFSGGSRIIVTTRDKHLLERHGIESTYDMDGFNAKESLELLKRNAFKTGQQVDSSYEDVLNRAIIYAQGLPLALEIIGANLYGMSTSEWESALDLYERIPEDSVLQRLKVSYDCLTKEQQNIFLDIACFFNGKGLEHAKFMVEQVNDFNPEYVIRVLVNKCLMKIVENVIVMHDLIRDMGREIVRKESPNKPGEWSRLWVTQDIVDVLEDNTGTDKIQMIIQGSASGREVKWDGEGFKYMKGLKLLIFENVEFSEGPKYLPNSLKVLSWRRYPYSCLPPNFCPKKLVNLDVSNSHLNSLETIKTANNLVVLNLQRCEYVREIPDLSDLQNLKELNLRSCENLIEIHASIGYLRKLEILDVDFCFQLKTFPRVIKSPSLRELSLSYCGSLKYFPEILENVKIAWLSIDGTGIEKFPWSICNLTKLRALRISQWELVIEIPSSIFLLPEIEEININCKEGKVMMSCNSKEAQQQHSIWPNKHDPSRVVESIVLPRCNISDDLITTYLSRFINVQYLNLSGNTITILPTWIKQCHLLERLKLNECKHLREVKWIPPNIQRLEALNCTSLSSDSKALLLSEELHGDPNRHTLGRYDSNRNEKYYFCVPSSSMPEWFEHRSNGASISFWFRNSFPPALCLCFVFKPKYARCYSRSAYPPYLYMRVSINGKEVCSLCFFYSDDTVGRWDDGHLVVCHLTKDHMPDDYEIQGHEWIDVRVEVSASTFFDVPDSDDEDYEYIICRLDCVYPDYNMCIEGIGMCAIKQLCDMQHISFHNPYEPILDSNTADQALLLGFTNIFDDGEDHGDDTEFRIHQ